MAAPVHLPKAPLSCPPRAFPGPAPPWPLHPETHSSSSRWWQWPRPAARWTRLSELTQLEVSLGGSGGSKSGRSPASQEPLRLAAEGGDVAPGDRVWGPPCL